MMLIIGVVILGLKQTPAEITKLDPAISGPNVNIYSYGYEGSNVAPKPFSMRMLICKHCREAMADGDANLAIQAINQGKEAGLDAKVIGNHLVEGLDQLRETLQQKIKDNAKAGDTLIVHTIGHGMPNGQLMTLGYRHQVSEILAAMAQEHKQEIIWWQLSCYAASQLPNINSLNPEQQKLFSNLTSSTASEPSPAYEQGYIMAKVFIALGQKNKNIDPNSDGVITASELRNFMNGLDHRRRGDLFFARSPDEPIFGRGLLPAQMLPIIDRNSKGIKYNEDYILAPK
jgi:hypothetical protein